jgi:hypothetical protein
VLDWLIREIDVLGRKWIWQLSSVSWFLLCFKIIFSSSYRCDHDYMGYLRDIFHQYLGENVVLFTVGMNDFEIFYILY